MSSIVWSSLVVFVLGCGTSSGSNEDSGPASPKPTGEARAIPTGRTSPSDLAPPGWHHHEVLRIDQDFHPNEDYEIALDAWVAQEKPDALAEVRMWWLDTSKAGERSPFGRGVRRHIDLVYRRQAHDHWTVAIEQGRKRFSFEIELMPDGRPRAYGDVVEGDTTVRHCRVETARLVANQFLGLPVGLDRLELTCVDDRGGRHHGVLLRR